MLSFTRFTSLIAPRGVSLAPTFSSKAFQPRFFSTVPQTTQTHNLVDKDKKKKKKKDPNAPKRPTPPYLLYLNSIRPQIVSSNPHLSVTEVTKEAGARWKVLSDEQKKTFIDQSSKDKVRYTAERETYLKNKPKVIKSPPNPYITFANEVRPDIVKKNPSFLLTQIAKETARLWRSLPDSQKAKYTIAYHSQLEKYRQLVPPKPKEPKVKVVTPKKIKATKTPEVKKPTKDTKDTEKAIPAKTDKKAVPKTK